MATSFSLEHSFPTISLEKFIKYLNDPRLNQLLEKNLPFDERSLLEKKAQANGEIIWKFRVQKAGILPASIKKIVGTESFAWQEISRFIPQESCLYWEIIPDTSKIKFSGKGSWRLSKAGTGCKRHISGELSVGLPIVGKIVEAFIVNELKNTYEIEPGLQEQFYASVK